MKLSGKRILITGGGSGIGLELACRMADHNHVVIAGRDEAKLERARAQNPRLSTLRLDITSEKSAENAIARLTRELDGLDLLINNAGVIRSGRLSGADAAGSIAEVETNLLGTIRMTRLALPLLRAADEPGVLFMSSAVALAAVPGVSVYAATKAAIHSLARSLRIELRSERIRVFEVLPPVVDTEFAQTLDVPKISAAEVADAVIAGLQRDTEEIRIGRVKQLARIARFSPRMADRIVASALRPPDRARTADVPSGPKGGAR